MPASAELTEGVGIAVAAESLYLVNLLLAPGLGFAALVWLWWSNRGSTPPLAAAHLAQTLSGSVWAGILLVVVNGLILLLGGCASRAPAVWSGRDGAAAQTPADLERTPDAVPRIEPLRLAGARFSRFNSRTSPPSNISTSARPPTT